MSFFFVEELFILLFDAKIFFPLSKLNEFDFVICLVIFLILFLPLGISIFNILFFSFNIFLLFSLVFFAAVLFNMFK